MAEAKKPMAETAKAKNAFEEYLLMGSNRSLRSLAKQMGRPASYVTQLERWSAQFHWQEKARAYDAEQAERRRREIEEERDKVDREHLLIGRAQAIAAVRMIQDLEKKGKYGLQAAAQLLKVSTDLQRLAIGSATQQIALTGKDGGPIEQDVEVTTFWGRGTDPRRKDEPLSPKESTEQFNEDAEQDDEWGIEVPDDDDNP